MTFIRKILDYQEKINLKLFPFLLALIIKQFFYLVTEVTALLTSI